METVSLRSGPVEVELNKDSGEFVTVRHRGFDIDLVTERRLCESFRILLPLPHRRGHYVEGRGQRLTNLEFRRDNSEALLEWRGLATNEGTFDITFKLLIRLAPDQVEFRSTVENGTSFTVEEVLCPAIGVSTGARHQVTGGSTTPAG